MIRSAATIWRQNQIPVVYRPEDGPLLVRVPYRADNRRWLREERLRKPVWCAQYKCWKMPRAWFGEIVRRLLGEFGEVYVIQPYRPKEVCAPACWNAQGFDCECSCMGANHGSEAGDGWYVISEACAIQWGAKQLGCRLLRMAGSRE